MLIEYGSMSFQDFLKIKLRNLLHLCVHIVKNFANHALSEMMILGRKLRRITFGVVVHVEYGSICALYPLPPSK